MKKAALYLRVSTGEQNNRNQARDLYEAAARHGWRIAEVFKDEGISGSKSREKRPAFDRLCRALTRREFDLVAAWAVDRLGRSLQDLVARFAFQALISISIGRARYEYACRQGAVSDDGGCSVSSSEPMIVERTLAGLARARAQGKVLGRPEEDGDRKRYPHRVANAVGCGVGAVRRIKRQFVA